MLYLIWEAICFAFGFIFFGPYGALVAVFFAAAVASIVDKVAHTDEK